jgi:non-specific serine/threonine protein kinase
MGRGAGHAVAEARCLGNLARLAYDVGDFVEARQWAEAGQARATDAGFGLARNVSRRILGLVAMQSGEPGTARALLEASLADSEELGGPWWAAQTLVSLAEVAIGEGNLDLACEHIAEALRTTHMLADQRETAHALEVCALLAVAQRNPTDGLRLVGAARAIRRTHRLELPPIERDALARCVTQAKRLLGSSATVEALAYGETLSVEAAMSSALCVAEARPTTGVHPNSNGILTKREQEVAALVARGLTNPQIADVLIIGERTAQTHVANILNKLGLSSRAQIAAWVAERGAVASRPTAQATLLSLDASPQISGSGRGRQRRR